MKIRLLTISIFIFIVSCLQNKITRVRYEGVYVCSVEPDTSEDADTTESYWEYLRFYPDGQVISVASSGSSSDIQEWFNLSHNLVSKGQYKVTEDKIYFRTKDSYGEVEYDGVIRDSILYLKCKSFINGIISNDKYVFCSDK